VIGVVLSGSAGPLSGQTVDIEGSSGRPEPSVAVAIDGLFNTGQVVGQPAGPPPTPRHTGIKALMKDLVSDVQHLPSKENLFWVGVGGGLALAVHPADDNLNSSLVHSDFADTFFTTGDILGELGILLGTAAGTYAVGRLTDQPKVSHVGMDLIQ